MVLYMLVSKRGSETRSVEVARGRTGRRGMVRLV